MVILFWERYCTLHLFGVILRAPCASLSCTSHLQKFNCFWLNSENRLLKFCFFTYVYRVVVQLIMSFLNFMIIILEKFWNNVLTELYLRHDFPFYWRWYQWVADYLAVIWRFLLNKIFLFYFRFQIVTKWLDKIQWLWLYSFYVTTFHFKFDNFVWPFKSVLWLWDFLGFILRLCYVSL